MGNNIPERQLRELKQLSDDGRKKDIILNENLGGYRLNVSLGIHLTLQAKRQA